MGFYWEVRRGDRQNCHTPSGNWNAAGIFQGGIMKYPETWGANGQPSHPYSGGTKGESSYWIPVKTTVVREDASVQKYSHCSLHLQVQ